MNREDKTFISKMDNQRRKLECYKNIYEGYYSLCALEDEEMSNEYNSYGDLFKRKYEVSEILFKSLIKDAEKMGLK